MIKNHLVTWTVILMTVIELTFGSSPLVVHGGTYVIKSVADDLIMTSNRHLFRKQGLRAGQLTVQKFDAANLSQFFDAIFVKGQTVAVGNDQVQLVWFMSHQNPLSSLSIHPYSEFPEKNFVALVPIPGENKNRQLLIRSPHIRNQCLQTQGRNLPVIYAPCDYNNKHQQFTAEFLYEAEKDTSEFPEAEKSFELAHSRYF